MIEIKITKIIWSKKRHTLALVIDHDANLIVHAPLHASLNYIEKIVRQKTSWIEKKMQEISMRPKSVKKKFFENEEFLYLGKKYRLRLTDELEIKLGENGELFFPRVFLWRAKMRMTDWYKKQALKEILLKVGEISRKLNLDYLSVKISNAKKNWGSCGPKNSLNFNWRLIMTPCFVMDYVIIHELMHIVEKNHSRNFWKNVSVVMPRYSEAQKYLKQNQQEINLF